MANEGEIEFSTEIIKNRLYFAVTYDDRTIVLKNTNDIFYFNVDEELVYYNYYYDFGPLNLSCLYKYCCKLNSYLRSGNTSTLKRIVHYTSSDQNKRSNAAFLIGSFAVIYLKMDPRHIFRLLLQAGGPYKNFLDASQGISTFTLRLIDCFNAIEKATSFNFFDFNDFNVVEYEAHSRLQFGDLNWLIPRKFLAFIGPTDAEVSHTRPPEHYLQYFLKNDVRVVVRLNNKTYDSYIFKQAGIHHFELFFPDGTTPPRVILLKFLDIVENSTGAIAVHCKAGLGRTGSLIGAYIVKHYQMTARETIAWLRICRPGSVIGQQQDWLEKIEGWLWRQGIHYRTEHFGGGDKIPRHKYGIYSKLWPLHRKKILAQIQANHYEKQEQTKKHHYAPCIASVSSYNTQEEQISNPKPKKVRKRNVGVATDMDFEDVRNMSTNSINRSQGDNEGKRKYKQNMFKCKEKLKSGSNTQGDKLNEIKYMQELGNNAYYKTNESNNYISEDTYEQVPLNNIDVSQFDDSESLQYLEYLLYSIELRKRMYQNMFNYMNRYYYDEDQ